jgi:hypothetical protein
MGRIYAMIILLRGVKENVTTALENRIFFSNDQPTNQISTMATKFADMAKGPKGKLIDTVGEDMLLFVVLFCI